MTAPSVAGSGQTCSRRHLYVEAVRAVGQVWLHAREAGDANLAKRAEKALGDLMELEDDPSTVRGATLRGTR